MKFVIERKQSDDTLDDVISFHGEVCSIDLMRLNLCKFDRVILDNAIGCIGANASDHLMVLEMIFRNSGH